MKKVEVNNLTEQLTKLVQDYFDVQVEGLDGSTRSVAEVDAEIAVLNASKAKAKEKQTTLLSQMQQVVPQIIEQTPPNAPHRGSVTVAIEGKGSVVWINGGGPYISGAAGTIIVGEKREA